MTAELWTAILGFVMPPLVAYVIRIDWPSQTKALIALAVSLVAGTVATWIGGGFTGEDWLQNVVIVFTASQVSFMLWWRDSGITDWIETRLGLKPKQPVGDPDSML